MSKLLYFHIELKNEAQQNKKHADIKDKRKRLDQPRQALEGQKLKSFFDFSIWTEVTRGARSCGWTREERETP